ncbi:MAG: 4'-phosphopantetheinyl transferase superfamily protein [Candidatus Binatus sp.]|uniref:4'-phosphopantetheinyl transferase family protein n=1 Tax=Candidatus Binatus sp. TaxID=2811406 RepID=UPI002724C9C9|nr:4'-phosphopantetheinyl transferase superfamily protein [Candidatus Binatus sp.]MDO8431609.1 4'-phosphopantetheinyl transferase superfamily protein [Candidatus Binatus sp.]
MSPNVHQIAEDEVHIWCVRLERIDEDLARSEAILSADEIERAQRYQFAHHRRRFIVARARLREMLAEYLGRPAESIQIEYNAWGKPSLGAETGADLRFNLSHTHDLAMYAFARKREVGVDIEAIDEKAAAGRVAENFFAANEVAALRALPAEYQAEAFFNCWTRKEACVKARGDGLSRDLKSFEVTLRPGEPAEIKRGAEWAGWSMFSIRPTAAHVAALVVEGVGIRVVGPRFR